MNKELCDNVTVEKMIVEGSITPKRAMGMGLKFEAKVIGGDALEIRKKWLEKRFRCI